MKISPQKISGATFPERYFWYRGIVLFSFTFSLLGFNFPKKLSAQKINIPIKILLRCQQEIGVGKSDTVEVTLANSDNQTTRSSVDVSINLSVSQLSGRAEATYVIPVKSGESSGRVAVPLNQRGVWQYRATEPHFLSGSGFVVVSDSKYWKENSIARVKMRGGKDMLIPLTIHDTVSIQFDSKRTFLADGKDSAQIFVTLNRDATSDIRVDLLTTQGSFKIIIPKGLSFGSANIVSDKSGKIEIQSAESSPDLPVQGIPFNLNFVNPIAKLHCIASPPTISLLDNAEIVITLLDDKDRPHATLIPRTVSFTIDKGRGEIETADLTIPAGSFEGRTHFRPTILGGINISGATGDLDPAKASLTVSLPIWILLLSILGGMAGGFFAKLKSNYEHWRILIGTVTGFVLYWAFIFGLLNVIPHDIALNPFSAFVISTLGGWMGTEVFSSLLSRFGILKKTA